MPFDTVQSDVLTVSAYAARLGRALRGVGGALIEGEIQKPKHSGSGTLWFSLTDGDATLPCKVFSRQVRSLSHVPREGDLVRIEVERPDLWAQTGKLDLIVRQVTLAGEGELLRRRQALIDLFAEQGLCDPARRRPLPRFPRAVGVIAGRESDAMSDVVQALIDRWPAVHIVTCDSLVQGKSAPHDLIDALAHMVEHPLVDVVIMARGGGSVQDLACFDDESLCRAVFACELPVVCAIGHTNNNPVCNYVGWPAYTPSRSAEMVVPCAREMRRDISVAQDRLAGVGTRLSVLKERLSRESERVSCVDAVDARQRVLSECAGTIEVRAGERVGRLSHEVHSLGDGVRNGTHRQANDHVRDYGRALARLAREVRACIDRHIDRTCELVCRERTVLGERTIRRLEAARRDAIHAGALIAAHDFRARGWVLAGNGDGAPIRSVTDLHAEQAITLRLHDGQAKAVIRSTSPHVERDES